MTQIETATNDDTSTPLAQRAGELADEAQGRIRAGLKESRATLLHLQESALARARAAGRVADDQLRDNPWRAVGVAAGIGLVIGLLLRRH